MRPTDDRRVAALEALNGLIELEVADLRRAHRDATGRLAAIDAELRAIDRDIGQAERQVRAALGPGRALALDEHRLWLAHLERRQRHRHNQARQRTLARAQVERIEGELAQRCLKTRGIDNARARRVSELQREDDKRQLAALDESWLLRKGEDHDQNIA